jgi:RNA polymerase sigma factor (sigma-70 family)
MRPVISEPALPVAVLELESDSALIGRSIADPHAFGCVFDRHFVAVHRYVHRRAGRDLADEIAAETFRVAFERRARWSRETPSARPWLLGIATNLLRRHRRTEGRRLRAFARSARDDWASFDEDAILARLDAEADAPQLAACLAALSARDRDAVTLVTLGGLTHAEAAEALGVPVGTVSSRMHRAQRRLAGVTIRTTEERHG